MEKYISLIEGCLKYSTPTRIMLWQNGPIPPYDFIQYDIVASYINITSLNKFDNTKITPIVFAYIWSNKFKDLPDNEKQNNFILINKFLSNFNSKIEYHQFVNGAETIYRFNREKYEERLEQLKFLQKLLNEVEYYDTTSKFRTKDKFLIEWEYYPINNIDIFDKIKLSEDVPYVVINIGEDGVGQKLIAKDRYFKTFNRHITNFTKWVNETNEPNSIMFKVYNFSRDRSDEDSYSDVVYDFEEAQWYFYFTHKRVSNIKEVFKALKETFPFDINFKLVSIKSEFDTNIYLDKFIFVDMIYNDKLLRNFIYIDENQKPLAIKKRLTLHMALDPDFDFKTTSTFTYREDTKNIGKLLVQLNMSHSIEIENLFFYIVRVLLTLYNNRAEGIMEWYNKYSNALNLPLFKYKVPEEGIKMTKLKKLVYQAEDMFIKGYATEICQSPFQPLIINDEEAGDYISRGFEPVRYEGYLFVSDNPEKPYISLKTNKLGNANKFPFLPCTSNKKTIDVDGEFEPVEIGSKTTIYKLDEFKILPKGRLGSLSSDKLNILDSKSGTSEAKRIYITSGPNSFLIGIMMALEMDIDEDSIEEVKEDLILMDKSVAKQELYDLSNERINSIIRNGDIDSYYFTRLFEIYFEVNIFVFTQRGIQIPNHYIFYLLSDDEKYDRTVVLYKHPNKRHELITTDVNLFDNKIRDRLRELITMKIGYYNFKNYYNIESKKVYSKIQLNPINKIDIKPLYQTLDGGGKARFLTYEVDGKRFSVEVLTAPLNIPEGKPIESSIISDISNVNNSNSKNNISLDKKLITNEISTYIKIKSFSYVLKQIIQIIYNYFVRENPRNNFENLFKIDKNYIYKHGLELTSIPEFDDFQDCYDFFSNRVPMIKNGLIYVDSDKTLEGVKHYIKTLIVSDINFVNIFNLPEDFTRYSSYQNIYMSQESIISFMINEKQNHIIRSKIEFDFEPYLYQYNEQVYIIQNVKGGEKERAQAILFYWDKYKINPGYEVSPIDYSVREIQTLTSKPSKCIFLSYNKWIAMIPIDINEYYKM